LGRTKKKVNLGTADDDGPRVTEVTLDSKLFQILTAATARGQSSMVDELVPGTVSVDVIAIVWRK
jgi:hypothetical protein